MTVHEVTFQLYVPETFQIKPRGDDLVVDVIVRQAGVGSVGNECGQSAPKKSGDRVARVIRTELEPIRDTVGPGDVPATDIAQDLRSVGVDELVAYVPAILRVDPQFAARVLPVELVCPIGFGGFVIGNEATCGVKGITSRAFARGVLVQSRGSDQQAPEWGGPPEICPVLQAAETFEVVFVLRQEIGITAIDAVTAMPGIGCIR